MMLTTTMMLLTTTMLRLLTMLRLATRIPLRAGHTFAIFLVAIQASHGALVRAQQDAASSAEALFHWEATKDTVRGAEWAARHGGRPAVFEAPVRTFVAGNGDLAGIVLDGKASSATVARLPLSPALPRQQLTVEARVVVRAKQEWGGIVGAIQDNGDDERGFLLGFRDDRFTFALATESRGRLLYLNAAARFELDRWYHVAGVYDGERQRIYIDGELAAEASATGAILAARSGHFEIGAYRDRNEHYRMQGVLHEVALHDRPLEGEELRRRFASKRTSLPGLPREIFGPFDTVVGPFLEFVTPGVATVSWETETPRTSVVELARDLLGDDVASRRRVERGKRTRHHRLEIDGLDRDTVYQLRLRGEGAGGEDLLTATYELDTSFDYAPSDVRPTGEAARSLSSRTHAVVRALCDALRGLPPGQLEPAGLDSPSLEGVDPLSRPRGLAILLGDVQADHALSLALLSDLQILLLEADLERLAALRERLDRAGVYGPRVTAQSTRVTGETFNPYFANLVVASASHLRGDGDLGRRLFRILRPVGGVLAVRDDGAPTSEPADDGSSPRSWLPEALLRQGVSHRVVVAGETLWLFRRGALPGAADWTHQYGRPDNTACNDDRRVRGRLGALWFGRPGPRAMPDRGPRNPAPLAANGRLYVQGNRTLFGLDAYNGTILWAKQIPTLRRANMPRDCSNMVATADHLYAAVGDRVVAFDGRTGRRDLEFRVLDGRDAGREYDWGYLGAVGRSLLGSGTRRGSHYLGDDGEWYEDFKPGETAKVTSDYIFSLDRFSGSVNWRHDGAVIINSTITVSDGKVFFVESRSGAARQAPGGRLQDEITTEQYLVALDRMTGEKLWDREVDLGGCEFSLYLCHADGKLVACGTDAKKVFHVRAFDATAGEDAWSHRVDTQKTHHSGHLARPVVVGERLFLNKHIYELKSGKVLRVDPFDYHGCGTMSASAGAIFHRFEYHGMLDLETGERTEFTGVRGGCWLGQIPAGGLLLAPESGAGCSCTHAFQTSVAFYPLED